MPGPADSPVVGDLALDTERGDVGIVMDVQGSRVFLRRPEGGREWEAPPEDVRPVPAPNGRRRPKAGAGAASRRVL
ncbi:hypothetical protein [Streptomyces sp. 8N706]|uniref:hypothetical protein n=1 Tax=Streptomyces sp. 8N706 TaxID=3457416 RepID=UPI003FD37009